MKGMTKSLIVLSLAVLIIGAATVGVTMWSAVELELAKGAEEDTSSGSFTLDATPAVSSVDFTDNTYTTTSTLTPGGTPFHVNFTVATSAQMSDLLNVTVWIFDDSDHGADYNSSAEDGIILVSFMWLEASDTWSVVDQGSLSNWSVDNDTSIDPGAGASDTSYEFAMNFSISEVAGADTDWNVTIHAYDDDGDVGYGAETVAVTMDDYFSVTFSTSTFSWGTQQPSAVNQTHGALTITVISNTQWELLINATDFNATGESDVDIEGNNIIVLDGDGSGGGESQWIRNTQAVVSGISGWDNQAAHTTESGVNKNVYILLNTGSFFDAGVGKTWSTWVTIYCQANT